MPESSEWATIRVDSSGHSVDPIPFTPPNLSSPKLSMLGPLPQIRWDVMHSHALAIALCHWGLRVLPSSLPLHTSPLWVPPSHLSCTCHLLSFHKSSKYFFLFSIFFLSRSPNSSNSSTSSASLIPWISLMHPSPHHSFKKCLSVSLAVGIWLTQTHTGQSTTPPKTHLGTSDGWCQFNLRVLVLLWLLHLNRVIEPLSFEYKPSSPILFFALYISRVSLSSTSILIFSPPTHFPRDFFFLFSFLSILHGSLLHAHTPPLASSLSKLRIESIVVTIDSIPAAPAAQASL